MVLSRYYPGYTFIDKRGGETMTTMTWILIAVCITQSGMLSGLNLAYFSIPRLTLELEVKQHNPHARRIQGLRRDANLLLATILWGNVGVNVLLAMLSNSIMAGLAAFFFSTFVITFAGEILPQAYFSRNALKMGSLLAPVIMIYRILLYPLAKPTGLFLDRWLGRESIQYYKERDVEQLLKLHVQSSESDIDRVEGKGALNFLAFDDIPISQEGEPVDPRSIISVEFIGSRPVFPEMERTHTDPFLTSVQASGLKWVLLIDSEGIPRLALNADRFLRHMLWGTDPIAPLAFCHRPIVITDPGAPLGPAVEKFKVHARNLEDDVIDDDLILLWNRDQRRIITGSDVLGRLLRGIASRRGAAEAAPEVR